MMFLGIELFESDRATVSTTWRSACGRIRVTHDRTAWREMPKRWTTRVETSNFAIEASDSSEYLLEVYVAQKLEDIAKQASDLLREAKSSEP